jgi:hypothetical protein
MLEPFSEYVSEEAKRRQGVSLCFFVPKLNTQLYREGTSRISELAL